jgi:hydrogenase maturation protease
MNIKVIAIGSRIMGDDGVAIEAAERLRNELVAEGVKVIIGETDVEYCLGCIDEGDFIIILDAAISGRPWGAVWHLPLNHDLIDYGERQFQHDADLLSILKTKEMLLSGLLICIEAADITQRWGLSEAILSQLPRICHEIKKVILEYRGDLQDA